MAEKGAPEFALPSPNFNRQPQNGPNKTSMHYLTPCGMTLLPRNKQPPPMYGARGSTVPAKYLNEGISKAQVAIETPPVYNSPPRPESCNNCDMELANSQDMKRHLQQHETCPAEDCDFSALSNILECHIESNHITGLYQKVKKVWTPEDIAAWRAERRKRFPTTANVELAKRAKEQRLKRGERLEASKSRFGKIEDRKRTRTTAPLAQGNKRKHKQNSFKSKQQHKKPKVETDQPSAKKLEEEEKDAPTSVVEKFRGTSGMLDYKHVKDKKSAENNALSNLLGMYGSDSDEDQEEVEDGSKDEMDTNTITPLSDEKVVEVKDVVVVELEGIEQNSAPLSDKKAATSSTPLTEENGVLEVTQIANLEAKDESHLPPSTDDDDDEGPDEVPIERLVITKCDENQQVIQKSQCDRDSKPSTSKPLVKQFIPIPNKTKRHSGLNYKRAKQLYRHTTMLSKLLESDIRHERNILLQCVRYVCEKDFFGIGSQSNNNNNVDVDPS
ncbi:FMR1-interacting protein NUFIP1 [Drosophila tropicalis]|uniref:FMR1-interacting protein NUFIP1 n=1 Tax=Drosophila tropicalis TaxID=46794 RepID=UPI0035AB9DC6